MDLHCLEELPMSPDFLTTNKKFQSMTAKSIPEKVEVMTSGVTKEHDKPKDKTRKEENTKQTTDMKENPKTTNAKKKKATLLKTKFNPDCTENGMKWSPSFKVTRKQLDALKDFFSLTRYPTSEERKIIAKNLGLAAEYVKGWFCRERRKYRSGKADYANLDLETETEENQHSGIFFYGSEDMEDLPYDLDDFTQLEFSNDNVREYSDVVYHSPDTDLLLGSAVMDSLSEDSDAMLTCDALDVTSEFVQNKSSVTNVSQQNIISFGSVGFAKYFKNQHLCEEDTLTLTIPCDPYCHDNNQNWFDDLLMAEGELRMDTYHFNGDAFINNDDMEFTTNLKYLEYISEHL